MIKKLIMSALAASMLLSYPVYAHEKSDFKAYISREDNTVVKLEAECGDQICPAVIYLSDNSLYSVEMVNIKNKSADISMALPKEAFTLKLYYDIGKDLCYSIAGEDMQYITEPTEENPKKEDNKETESIYSNAEAQKGAVAVVKSVETVVDDNNDIVNRLRFYYMGAERKIVTEEDFSIGEASEYLKEDIGKSITTLSEGDIIRLYTNLSGDKVIKVALLMRAPQKDIILGETEDKAPIYLDRDDKSTYIFGILKEITDNNVMVLYNESGLEKQAQYLEFDETTIAYIYNNENKDKLKIGSVWGIRPSFISESSMDEFENIVKWEKDERRTYVFARMYKGVVYDCVAYQGYAENN